jgi:tetratricopeptide (TPR) repeat protein
VVTEGFYESAPCRRFEKALADPTAVETMGMFVLLRIAEKEDLALSKGLGLEDLGHPYTALLDEEGRPLAWLRGAFGAADWAKEVRRLAAACDAVEARRAALAKAPGDARALWELSEALRDAGRVRDADETLARAENADPDGKSGLLPLFRFRRLEARVEDRMAVQDFEGVKTLVDAYDREFPGSPRRPWVAFYRAVARACRGETDAALDDLREVAAGAKGKDAALVAAVEARIAALDRVIERRK